MKKCMYTYKVSNIFRFSRTSPGQVTKQENEFSLNQGHIARPMHDFQEQCQAVFFVMVCLSLLSSKKPFL